MNARLAAGRRAQESEIIQKFQQIREMAAGLELVQDAAELWGSAGRIRILCKEILQLLDHECVESEEVEDYANEGSSSVTRIFREIWELARDILSSEEAANECMEVIPRAEWVQACSRRILCATRRIEELLGPGRALEVLSSADPEAAQADEAGTVTHPTALPHAPPPVAGSVTADTWSDFDWEPAGFPDSAGYGADVIARQNLEQQLLELEKRYLSKRHPEIAAVLHALGHAWNKAGYLQEAQQHFAAALQRSCSLHVKKCRPDIARHLFALGRLNLEMGDIPRAKQHLEASS